MKLFKVGNSFCLLSFLEKEDLDHYVSRYAKMFELWFDNYRPWADLDLAIGNQHWVSFFDVPPFLWHDVFFLKRLGSEVGVGS